MIRVLDNCFSVDEKRKMCILSGKYKKLAASHFSLKAALGGLLAGNALSIALEDCVYCAQPTE
ncbi:MAG: hypothetical protein H6Q73_3818 [Firmicutes bacterium]|nr:hypothetical protein [Bacillota bacterium]